MRDDAFTAIFRAEQARVVGALVRRFGDVALAEDAAAEAWEVALERWPADGVPPNPGGWLTTTATRRALDRLRRAERGVVKEKEAAMLADREVVPLGVIDDDRLRLLFMCAHPALAPETRVALTLRLVAGLTVEEIAAALLVPERTLAQRITRAKRKIRDTGMPFTIPVRDDLPARLGAVMTVVYLVSTRGTCLPVGRQPPGTTLQSRPSGWAGCWWNRCRRTWRRKDCWR